MSERKVRVRFAPSPTGALHIGGVRTALYNYLFARQHGGALVFRIEDTDSHRFVPGAEEYIIESFKWLGIKFDEGVSFGGNYGPYRQSERRDIYKKYVQVLLDNGKAYIAFDTPEELEAKRKEVPNFQYDASTRMSMRNSLTMPKEEVDKLIAEGKQYVVRFKIEPNEDVHVHDIIRGEVVINSSILDDKVLYKSADELPTYHLANIVDDHLMEISHVIRGEEWLPSVPIHIELFRAFDEKPPKYIHIPLILKKDGETIRKISKRKDPEASMSYYKEKGYPVESVIESLMTIINSNYEEWHTANPDKNYLDFEFSPKKMSSSGGALYDIEKLNNISKNFISKLKASEVYDRVLNWAKEFDLEFYQLLQEYKDYSIAIFNIEREQKKPRKDYENYSSVKLQIWYMYDELFNKENLVYEFSKIQDSKEIATILNTYIEKYYQEENNQEEWFNQIKLMCDELGYASNMKEYKEHPEQFKGNVADVSTVL